MTVIVAPPDVTRPEWLAWRRSGLGASDIAAVLGISPWSSPWAVWADKVGLLSLDDDSDDDDREFGRRAELMISPWFADRTGYHVAATQLWATSDDIPWMLATPDGAVTDRDYCTHGGDCPFPSHPRSVHGPWPLRTEDLDLLDLQGLEAKTEFDSKAWAEIPVHYQAQGQQQMFTAGWERVWFAVLHGRRFRVYVLDRDQADIDEMIERATEFWQHHVLGRVPPPIDGSEATLDALAAMYPHADLASRRELDHIQGTIADLALAKVELAEAKAKARGAEAVIRDAMEDAYEGTIAGQRVLTLRSQTQRRICRHCSAVDETAPFRVLNLTTTKGSRV